MPSLQGLQQDLNKRLLQVNKLKYMVIKTKLLTLLPIFFHNLIRLKGLQTAMARFEPAQIQGILKQSLHH